MIIPINMATGSYDIVLERGALGHVEDYLALNRKALIVTDDGVPERYVQAVAARCAAAVIVTLPCGEKSKCLENYRLLLEKMIASSFSRCDCVVAVGGGVVGDLAGFAAATYMRGIDFYNIATTFLSQVDSSIGGKVAIDMAGVKNIVGAFYQPKKVIIDPEVLQTLDSRQLHAGLAESIKMAATSDAELFALLELSEDFSRDCDRIIEGSLRIKKAVVEQDPTEKGLRRVLNFGHTIGHAIESNKMGEYLHGECVALGMLPMCSQLVRRRLLAVLKKYGLPVSVDVKKEALLPFVAHDKKMLAGGISVVYVEEIGHFVFKTAKLEDIRQYLEVLEGQ